MKQIAAVAGVAEDSTKTALKEVVGTGGMTLKKPSVFPVRGTLFSVGIGLVAGFSTALPDIFALPAVIAAVLYISVFAVTCMKTGSVLRFQVRNLVLWLASGLAAAQVGDSLLLDIAFTTLLVWILSSITGGLLVWLGPNEEF